MSPRGRPWLRVPGFGRGIAQHLTGPFVGRSSCGGGGVGRNEEGRVDDVDGEGQFLGDLAARGGSPYPQRVRGCRVAADGDDHFAVVKRHDEAQQHDHAQDGQRCEHPGRLEATAAAGGRCGRRVIAGCNCCCGVGGGRRHVNSKLTKNGDQKSRGLFANDLLVRRWEKV